MDTIHLTYHKSDFRGYNFEDLFQSLQPLTNDFITTQWDGKFVKKGGNYNNLRFTFMDDMFTIWGSIARFHNGNNIRPLSCAGFYDAIITLSNDFDFPFEEGRVSRIDFAETFQVSRKPKAYYPLLQTYARMGCYASKARNGIEFSNKSRKLAFYDKYKETSHSQKAYLPQFSNENQLRYELQLRKNPSNELKIYNLKAMDFFIQANYDKLVKKWQDEYVKIKKAYTFSNLIEIKGTPSDIFDQLGIIGLNKIGETNFLNLLQIAQNAGDITSGQKALITKKIANSIKCTPILTKSNPLIDELDNLIMGYKFP
jgi:hypothetical protein